MFEFDCRVLRWIHSNTRLELDNLIWNFEPRSMIFSSLLNMSNVPIYENMFI